MTTVTGVSKDRFLALEAATIVDGSIDGSGHLILTTHDGTEIDAGYALVAVPEASTSTEGVVKLATTAEVEAHTNVYHAITPDSLASTVTRLDSADTALDGRLDTIEAKGPEAYGITGEMRMWPVAAAPTGWMLCEGGAISRTTYAALFALIGTNYGVGDGSTTFNIPDMRGRVPAGFDSTQTEFNNRGKTGGEKTHLLTSTEMPAHTHVQNSHGHSFVGGGNGALTDSSTGTNYAVQNGSFYGFKAQQPPVTTAVNQSTGGGGAHNNLQPYLTVKYIIKL